MSGWLRWLFGLREREVPDGAITRIDFPGMPHGTSAWIAGAVILLTLLLIGALYRREVELGRGKRVLLASLRMLALVIVVIMLVNPQLFTTIQLERRGQTFLLFDTSASMDEKDQFDGDIRDGLEEATGLHLYQPESRLRLTTEAVKFQEFVAQLEERNRVRLFGFDTELRAVPDLDALRDQSPTRDGTHVGSVLREVLEEAGHDPMAGVVLFGDGRSTGGEKWTGLVGEYATRGIPVCTVAVGKERLLKNIAVRKLVAPQTAAIGFPIRIDARVEAKGVERKRNIVVTLKRLPERGGRSETIERRELKLKGGELSESLTFYDTLKERGTYHYVLDVEMHRDETNVRDNKRFIKVVAAEETSRVLLYAGSPTYEYKWLRRFLERDEGVQVSCWNASADADFVQDGDVVLDRAPWGERDLKPYDVIILLDPLPQTLESRFLEPLKNLVVEHGTGLVYVAGENNQRPGANATLAALLPVEFDQRGGYRPSDFYDRPWQPVLTPGGAEHPVCRLADDAEENISIWERLPSFYFVAPVPMANLRPAAVALLTHEDEVVAAAQIAGAGYSVYVGTDDLYRWRESSAPYNLHERFWGAMIRYLASGKKRAGNKDGSLYVDRDRYDLGEPITIEASLMDSEKRPILRPELKINVEYTPRAVAARDRPSGRAELASAAASSGGLQTAAARETAPESVSLARVPERPGWYRGTLTTSAAGFYSLASEAGAEASFEVLRLTAELEDPSPDSYTLQELATQTGGEFVGLGELDRVARRLPDRTIKETVGRSASTLWDSPLFLFLLCGLLILEWVLRKLWRLH